MIGSSKILVCLVRFLWALNPSDFVCFGCRGLRVVLILTSIINILTFVVAMVTEMVTCRHLKADIDERLTV